jgi:hypothetical protein
MQPKQGQSEEAVPASILSWEESGRARPLADSLEIATHIHWACELE